MNKSTVISPRSTDVITIGDLKDNYFEHKPVSFEQITALKSFDKYKVKLLSKIENDAEFQKQYFEIQIVENTMDYREFLASFGEKH